MNREEALKIRCPKCGARPGRGCVSPRGDRRMQLHLDRYGIVRAKKPKPELRSYKMNEEAVWKAAANMGEHFGQVIAGMYPIMLDKTGFRPESPIEEMMLAAFVGINLINPDFVLPGWRKGYRPSGGDHTFTVHCQKTFGQYRADFAIEVECAVGDTTTTHWIIVECDGHQFHDRTPWQVGRDKARDRYFNAEGFTVLRFTGTEIHADAGECAVEVLNACDAARKRIVGQ